MIFGGQSALCRYCDVVAVGCLMTSTAGTDDMVMQFSGSSWELILILFGDAGICFS